jgi:hypothetical protein
MGGATVHAPNGQTFEAYCDLIDVTSLHRMDPAWRFVDAAGHVHVWYDAETNQPATKYDPTCRYVVPTIEWVIDGYDYEDGDDEGVPYGHHECSECRERVVPGYRPDDHVQQIAGLMHYLVDGHHVSKSEFYAAARAAGIPIQETSS